MSHPTIESFRLDLDHLERLSRIDLHEFAPTERAVYWRSVVARSTQRLENSAMMGETTAEDVTRLVVALERIRLVDRALWRLGHRLG